MGEVYLAHDLSLDRSVALKVLPRALAADPSRSRRLIQEAQTASAINHPNVCVIHEVGKSTDGRSFIAMEYVEGELLASKIKAGPLELKETVEIGIQVADALEEAHSKGIIHRDIKPANIVITPRGQAKVLDFGLARMAAPDNQVPISDQSTQARTRTGILLGTVEYMSPEQALGREVDARSDIFSFGVVLFEMATGQALTGKTLSIRLIALPMPSPNPFRLNKAVSSELQAIISKCLEKDLSGVTIGWSAGAGTRRTEARCASPALSQGETGSRSSQHPACFAVDTLGAAGDVRMVRTDRTAF
jgi:serine/threonine protein kinase